MSDSIRLHKEKGLNPRMTVCRRCGKDGREIVLVGARDSVYRCGDCETEIYGHGSAVEKCPACGGKGPHGFLRKIQDDERLPVGLCDACEAETKLHEQVVAEGGIYFRCSDCKKSGVIKASAKLAGMVRENLGIKAPKPCGVEFTKADGCPACGEGVDGKK